MIVFPHMLTPAAKEAGMKYPPDPDNYEQEEYPHFWVFCALQLCRSMSSHNQHWENAIVIAKIPEDRLKTMTVSDFEKEGVVLS